MFRQELILPKILFMSREAACLKSCHRRCILLWTNLKGQTLHNSIFYLKPCIKKEEILFVLSLWESFSTCEIISILAQYAYIIAGTYALLERKSSNLFCACLMIFWRVGYVHHWLLFLAPQISVFVITVSWRISCFIILSLLLNVNKYIILGQTKSWRAKATTFYCWAPRCCNNWTNHCD